MTMAPLVYVRSNTDALIDMFTAGTLMPAITYTGTVLLYGAVALGFAIAYPFAFLTNRYMIARGTGHAVVHEYH